MQRRNKKIRGIYHSQFVNLRHLATQLFHCSFAIALRFSLRNWACLLCRMSKCFALKLSQQIEGGMFFLSFVFVVVCMMTREHELEVYFKSHYHIFVVVVVCNDDVSRAFLRAANGPEWWRRVLPRTSCNQIIICVNVFGMWAVNALLFYDILSVLLAKLWFGPIFHIIR